MFFQKRPPDQCLFGFRFLVSTFATASLAGRYAFFAMICLMLSRSAFADGDIKQKRESVDVNERQVDISPSPTCEMVIDLGTALRLAESQNPRIAHGREVVNEAIAQHKEARALLFPTLTAGTDYHLHSGVLQTSFGQIRNVNSQSLYFGGGTQTVGTQTIGIPAVRIFAHAGDAYYLPLAAGQMVTARAYESHAIDNVTLLDVAEVI
jgi:hypothetical protein